MRSTTERGDPVHFKNEVRRQYILMLLNIADTNDSGLNCLIVAAICACRYHGDKHPVQSIKTTLTTFVQCDNLAALLRDAICSRIASQGLPGLIATEEVKKRTIAAIRRGEQVGEIELQIALV